MTQHRTDPDRLSNYFDKLLEGTGPRARCAFTDIDAIDVAGSDHRVDAMTHDRDTHRFLFQEFKQYDERPMQRHGQKEALIALARRADFVNVWCVRVRPDGLLDWYDIRSQRYDRGITTEEYRERFRRWWKREPPVLPDTPLRNVPVRLEPAAAAATAAPVTAADIRWSTDDVRR